MDHQTVYAFLGVIACASVLVVESAGIGNSTSNATVTTPVGVTVAPGSVTVASGGATAAPAGVTVAPPSSTTTAFVPYTCTQGTCDGTDSSCLNDIKSTCPISAPDHVCQVSIDNNTVTGDCVTKPCTETATLKCCQSAGCSSELFKSNNDNGIQACIATIVTLATVVMAIFN